MLNLSSILQTLQELTKMNATFVWDDQYEKLYKMAKNHILEEAYTLCYYDLELPLSMEMMLVSQDWELYCCRVVDPFHSCPEH